MRILYLNPTGALGGAERSLLDLLASIRSLQPRHQLHLIVCSDGPLVAAAQSAGVIVNSIPMPTTLAQAGDSGLRDAQPRNALTSALGLLGAGMAARRYAGVLRDAIQKLRPDLIHSNGIKTHLLTALARAAEAPRVWHARDFLDTRPVVGRLIRYSIGAGIRVIANSQAVADDWRGTLGRKADRVPIDVVYNGIDTDAFSPAATDGSRLDLLSHLRPAAPGTVRVGLVATYARWKGQDLFLRAARRIVERGLAGAMRFYVVGGAVYRTRGSQFSERELRELTTRLGISDRVGFVPFQPDPVEVYQSLDIVVHASTRPEPFGRTIVEAMSCGRAVIVSDEGGARELFRDGYDALAVFPRDADALASAIVRLADDAELRVRLGRKARETAVRQFDRKCMANGVLRVYESLCADASEASCNAS